MHVSDQLESVHGIVYEVNDGDYGARGSVSKRVNGVSSGLTWIVYRYINRGLYEQDKLTFVLIVTIKILVTRGELSRNDLANFLRGGAALGSDAKKNPFKRWLPDDSWMNVLALSQTSNFWHSLVEDITRNESSWETWYESSTPETAQVPDYEQSLE